MASETTFTAIGTEPQAAATEKAALNVLLAIGFCHLLNDTIQSLLPAVYPILKNSFHLDFGQIGLIALTSLFTASLLQPVVGHFTDRHHKPYSLAIGMGITLVGLLILSRAPNYRTVLVAAALVGIGSAVFHPESSRVARMASGGQLGLAQSLFQVGGNAGTALGPLLAVFVLPRGQSSIAWFSLVALLAIIFLARIGAWAKKERASKRESHAVHADGSAPPAVASQHSTVSGGRTGAREKVAFPLAILIALMFSKFFYLASLNSYYMFYLISKFHVSLQSAQLHLFVFLGAVAVGTFFGGPVGDRMGRKYVIWYSILGVLPFTLVLPYANLFWTSILSVVIGLILASAFSAILVYAQELLPHRVGMISGLFFGFAFGLGGIGSALLGKLADYTSIDFVYRVCAFLPAIGILTAFLPDREPNKSHAARSSAA
jgi:MFS transporter, FSR family, fosmidomycin resistance protein